MTTPIDDLERRLRATLDRQAREAPPGAPLAERILLEVDAPVLRPRHGWRVWISPMIAAAAIIAAALALVGLGNDHHGAAPAPAGTHSARPTPSPVHRHPSRPAPTASPTASPTIASTTVRTVATAVRGFRAADISFDSPAEGWALGSATCLNGSGRCTEILHTTDGTDWSPAPNGESFNVPGVRNCADPCVTNLRFANSSVGYAYGEKALFMTTDGGAHWARQPGLGATLLETVGGNVVLVRANDRSAPLFRRADVGSSTWTPFTVPGFGVPVGGTVQLSRAFGATLLTVTAYDPAKPASNSGELFRSTDGGVTWQHLPSPCGRVGRRFVAAATVSAGDGSLVADCALQTSADPVGIGSTVSAAAGSTRFSHPHYSGTVTPARVLAAPSQHVHLVVTNDGTMYRSTDSGDTWTTVAQPSGVSYLGFHSGTDGRALGDGGRALWTTSDAGATWTGLLFPR